MAEVIGVRFKNVGKVYYFDPDGVQMPKGSRVIVETARGVECGQVAMANRQVADGTIVKPLKKVVRAATQEDLDKLERNRKKEKEAYAVCLKKIEKFHLDKSVPDAPHARSVCAHPELYWKAVTDFINKHI